MKRAIILGGGIIVLVVLLAGAAFVGGQLLSGQGLPGLWSVGGPGGMNKITINVQPAKELPQTPADARGLFDHRQDNSIFVGPDPVHLGVSVRRLLQTPSSHTGPMVEVVVSPQTLVYKDVTEQQFNGQPPSSQKIQVVEAGRIEEIGEGSMITAWGKKTGDRIIANVLVYSPPPVMNKP